MFGLTSFAVQALIRSVTAKALAEGIKPAKVDLTSATTARVIALDGSIHSF